MSTMDQVSSTSSGHDDLKFFFLSGNVLSSRRLRSYSLKDKTSKDESSYTFSDYVNSSLVYHDGKVYILGGEKGGNSTSSEVHIFDLEKRTWTKGPPMIEGRCEFNAIQMDGYIYAIGADQYEEYEEPEPEVKDRKKRRKKDKEIERQVTREWIGTNSVERLRIFPTIGKHWRRVDYMNYSRHNSSTAALSNKLYTVAGNAAAEGESMQASTYVECFDPSIVVKEDDKVFNGTWSTRASLKTPRIGLCVVAAYGKLYAFGGGTEYKGRDETDINKLNTLEIYDPNQDTWTDGPQMHRKRKYFGAFFYNDCIYAVGGDKEESQGATIEKFDLKRNRWILLKDDEGAPLILDDEYAHLWYIAFMH